MYRTLAGVQSALGFLLHKHLKFGSLWGPWSAGFLSLEVLFKSASHSLFPRTSNRRSYGTFAKWDPLDIADLQIEKHTYSSSLLQRSSTGPIYHLP